MATEINTRDAILTEWYIGYFPKACRYIQKNGGSLEDAKEVFQLAIIGLYERKYVDANDIKNEEAYLISIVKNEWITTVKRQARTTSMDAVEISDSTTSYPEQEKIYHLIQSAGRKCLDLLQSFYYEKLSMKSLAKKFGYGTERSATVQKYKCLEKVRDEVKSKSMSYEDFLS